MAALPIGAHRRLNRCEIKSVVITEIRIVGCNDHIDTAIRIGPRFCRQLKNRVKVGTVERMLIQMDPESGERVIPVIIELSANQIAALSVMSPSLRMKKVRG